MPHGSTIFFLMMASFGAGFVDSIAGGGGLISLPALLAAGIPPQIALATNKGQSVFGALMSAGSYFRHGTIDKTRAPVAFACGIAGSLIGVHALLSMRPEPLRPIVIVLLLVAAAVMVLKGHVHQVPRDVAYPRLAVAGIAIVLGAYDGFFGPGVGAMLVVACMLVFGDSTLRATSNAKVINLASNMAAFTIFALRGKILWPVSLAMAATNMTGALIGSRLAIRNGDRFIRAIVLVVVALAIGKLSFDLASS